MIKSICSILSFLLVFPVISQIRIANELIHGPSSSVAEWSAISTFNNKLFLLVEHGNTGYEPSFYDPEIDTFILLRDLTFGTDGSNMFDITGNSEKLFFKSNNSLKNTIDLYVVYNNYNSVFKVTEYRTAANMIYGYQDMAFGPGGLFVNLFNANYGAELFVTEGSSLSTKLVVDIYPGMKSSNPERMFYNEKLNLVFFQAVNPKGKYVPMVTRGTIASTKEIIKNSLLKENPVTNFSNFNGKTLFGMKTGKTPNGSQTLHSLFISDGTEKGTVQIFNSVLRSDTYGFTNFIEVDSLIYFTGDQQIFVSSGTVGNTRTLFDSDSTYQILKILRLKNKLIFFAEGDLSQIQIGEISLLTGKTQFITSINKYFLLYVRPLEILEFQDKIYFVATDGLNEDQIWVTDGTASGTKLFFDIDPGPNSFTGLTPIRNKMYFLGSDKFHGNEIYVYEPVITSNNPGLPIVKSDCIIHQDQNNLNVFSEDNLQSIHLLHLSGQIVFSSTSFNNQNITIPTTGFPSGVYIMNSITKSSHICIQKVLIH